MISRFELSLGDPGNDIPFAPAVFGPKARKADSATRKARTLSSHNVPPGYACAVHADNPRSVSYSSSQGIDYHVAGKSVNSCLFGVGVQRMEITSSLQRFESSSWVERASATNYAWMVGGDLYADADFNCNHANSRYYRTVGFAWVIRNGVGWGAANESSAVWKTCPDSF